MDDQNNDKTPPAKRRKINNEDHDTSESDSEKSSFSDDGFYLFDVLIECSLIKNLSVNEDICLEIADWSFGFLVKCIECDKEDHVDNKYEETEQWMPLRESDGWNDDYNACRKCYDEHCCTYCQESEGNIEYSEDTFKCEGCEYSVCPHHEHEHLQDCETYRDEKYEEELMYGNDYFPGY